MSPSDGNGAKDDWHSSPCSCSLPSARSEFNTLRLPRYLILAAAAVAGTSYALRSTDTARVRGGVRRCRTTAIELERCLWVIRRLEKCAAIATCASCVRLCMHGRTIPDHPWPRARQTGLLFPAKPHLIPC